MRVVLDTNVLLSGLMFPDGAPGRIVAAWREARFDLVISVHQLAEIGRALAYPKIRRILGWDDSRIEQFIRQLYVRAEVVDLSCASVEVPLDPDDVPILATLFAAKADVLITGDGDLLALRGKHSIHTPAEFVRKL
ncbi:MAG: putative toxin-antitoxin system toxin component, PIN family [Gammaproteobacteria bacterium]